MASVWPKPGNNQGSWYDAQVAALALFLQKDDFASKIVELSKAKRIAQQIAPDGRQPEELRRTRSLSYSLFNLEALCTLAQLGERTQVDLWNFQTEDGRSIRRAIDFILPALLGERQWLGAQLTKLDPSAHVLLVYRAAVHYREQRYRDAFLQFAQTATARSKAELLYGEYAK